MARTYTPTQKRYNDPYQQRILQFDTQDPRVYLSRVSNYILKSIGNDAIVNGIDVTTSIESNVVTVTISSGLILQDLTLIDVTEETILTFDISAFDPCNGCLILYTDYRYIESIESNVFRFKLSYLTNDGTLLVPITDPWDHNRNRIYLELIRFTTESTSLVSSPDYFYIAGKKYYRRGRLNFLTGGESSSSDLNILHNLNSLNIFSQLYTDDYYNLKTHSLLLKDANSVDLDIETYKPFDGAYQFIIGNPSDVNSFTVYSNSFADYICTLDHNLDQQYLQVYIYDEDNQLVTPRSIVLEDENTLLIDFSNRSVDLAATYKIYLIKNILEYQISNPISEPILEVVHNLNKQHLLIQVVDDSTGLLLQELPNIQLQDPNSLLIDTYSCSNLSSGDYTILFYQNIVSIFNVYSNNRYELAYHLYLKEITIPTDLVDSKVIIQHNLNNKYNTIQLLDSNNFIVQPDEVHIIDDNALELIFNDNISTETLTVIIYRLSSAFPLSIDEETNLYSLELLPTSTPIFQFYNSDDYLIQPNEITNVDNTYYFDFLEDLAAIKVVVGYGFRSYTDTFNLSEESNVIINHNLDTDYPIVQVYEDTNVIMPEDIQVLDSNNISVTLTELSNYTVNIISGLKRYVGISQPGQPIVWRGPWNDTTTYNAYDAVEFNGASYVANYLNLNRQPDIYPEWDLWVSDSGSVILSGTIAPTTIVGTNGDYYINISNGNFYGPKVSDTWLPPLSLIGPQGPVGPQGPIGPEGTGLPLTPTTGDIVIYDGADWVSLPSGSENQILVAQGTGVLPVWKTIPSIDTLNFDNWEAFPGYYIETLFEYPDELTTTEYLKDSSDDSVFATRTIVESGTTTIITVVCSALSINRQNTIVDNTTSIIQTIEDVV